MTPAEFRLLVVHGHKDRRETMRRVLAAERVQAHALVFSGHLEAQFMRDAWRGPTLPVRLIDERSTTTRENVANCSRVARRATHVIVVTSWWHAPRAWIHWRKANVRVTIRPSAGSLRYVPGEIKNLAKVPAGRA